MSGPWRLFVAIYPPPETAAAFIDALHTLTLPPHRQTPPAQIHLTAQFIGDTSPREFAAVRESVARSCAGLSWFHLAPGRLITLPQRGPARLIAVETDAPAPLLELHRRLAARLARNSRAHREERFLPHLTIARFAGGAGARVDQLLSVPPFAVSRVSLVRSVLLLDHAEHSPVEEFTLS